MKNIQLVFFLLGIFNLTNCKISENQIVGIYHNTYFGDTLKINSDKSCVPQLLTWGARWSGKADRLRGAREFDVPQS